MEAPRLVWAFLESWDARQGGIRVKTEDELSMPVEKPGYASDMSSATNTAGAALKEAWVGRRLPAPLLVFFWNF